MMSIEEFEEFGERHGPAALIASIVMALGVLVGPTWVFSGSFATVQADLASIKESQAQERHTSEKTREEMRAGLEKLAAELAAVSNQSARMSAQTDAVERDFRELRDYVDRELERLDDRFQSVDHAAGFNRNKIDRLTIQFETLSKGGDRQ